ncbi:MAG: GNAT family N-acetyltransferase [Saprospiraceae bacterium]|nr:GNAT family N-acetyltransferase [Saprospiraceae bacterium]MBL0027150.1 GNAT family N-acetyltransferase [Saprospiraceae bacterium]
MEFKLRPWKLTDAGSLVKYANNLNIAKYLTDLFPHPYSSDDAIKFITMVSSGNPVSVFAIEIYGEASGGIGLHPQKDIFRNNAELGYWLAEPYWGQGIITRAIREMVKFGFENLDINRIYARPFGSNVGSQKVLEKAGFALEGRFLKTLIKMGEYEDELVYAVRK